MRQQKKRRYNDRDEDEKERTPEPVEDPLRNATTLYVGNLYVRSISLCKRAYVSPIKY